MELLPILIGVQEFLLAAILLYSIPRPQTVDLQEGACQQNEALASSHIFWSPAVLSGAWAGPSGFACLGAVSCLIGYVLGVYISRWDLRTPPCTKSDTASAHNGAAAEFSRLTCMQYYHQSKYLVCGILASAASASAAKLSVLAGQAAEAARAAGEAAAAAATDSTSNVHNRVMGADMDNADFRCCCADWAAVGSSAFAPSVVLLSDSISSGTSAASTELDLSNNGTNFSSGGYAGLDPGVVNRSEAITTDSTCSQEIPVGNSSAAVAGAALAALQQVGSAATVCTATHSMHSPNAHNSLQMQQHQPPPPLQQPTTFRQHHHQQQVLLPVCSPPPNQLLPASSSKPAGLKTQPSQTKSRANAATTPLGCGWTCVVSCSQRDQQSLLRLQDPLAWQQGVACRAVQQLGVPGEDISLSVVLGAGAYGKVYKGQWRGQPVAVKILYHTGSLSAAKVAEEAGMMLQAKHENVICSHHVLMWQRLTSNSSSADAHHNTGMLSSMFASQCDELTGRGGQSYGRATGSSGSSTPLCSVIQGTQEGEAGGWLQSGQDSLDEDDVEAQTWIVQELCDAGPLDAAVRDGKVAGTEQVLACLLEVARGLEYLHNRGLVHGDLKAANVCLVNIPSEGSQAAAAAGACQAGGADPSPSSSRSGSGASSASKDFICKVMDFSLSKILDPGKTHCSTHSMGTVTHMAPELLTSGKQSRAADVYSYGMLVWEVLNKGKMPYHGLHSVEIVQRIVHEQQRPNWQTDAHPQLVAMAEQCWSADPRQRPSISDVCDRLLQIQHAVQQLKKSSTCSSTSAAAAAITAKPPQQQLDLSLSAPLPDVLCTGTAVSSSRSFPLLGVDHGWTSTSSNSTTHSTPCSLGLGTVCTGKGELQAQVTSCGSFAYVVTPPVTPHAMHASAAPCELIAQPEATAAGLATPNPADATECSSCQEGASSSGSASTGSSSSSSSLEVESVGMRRPAKRSFSFSHVVSQPAALQPIPEGMVVELDLLNLTLKALPGQQGPQAAKPDYAQVEVIRRRAQIMHSPERLDDQAGSVAQTVRMINQALVRPDNQAAQDAARAADHAGLESSTGTWKMRRHSQGSLGKALRAAAAVGSAVALAADSSTVGSSTAIVAAVPSAVLGADAAANCGGSQASTSDSSALEPWEGLLVTGRKGMIRGVDCSALNCEDLPPVWQQRQEQRHLGTDKAVVSQGTAVAPASSAGEAVGPVVGYWD